MCCVDCHMGLLATMVQAKKHGWKIWVGGAQCKSCFRKEADSILAGVAKEPGEEKSAKPEHGALCFCVECLGEARPMDVIRP